MKAHCMYYFDIEEMWGMDMELDTKQKILIAIYIEFLWDDGEVQYVGLGYMLISSYGIDYVEQKLGIDKTLSGIDKAKYIITKSGEWGIDQLKDFGSKVVAEIIKSNIGV